MKLNWTPIRICLIGGLMRYGIKSEVFNPISYYTKGVSMRSRNLVVSNMITVLLCIGLLSIHVIGCGGSSGGGDSDGDSKI
jgi:hypothetical protein